MKKKEKGITLIVLVVTIIIMLILASIGIASFNYNQNNVMETSENIVKNDIKQEYIDAVQMVISQVQLKYATKEVDKEYFNKIVNILASSGQFAGAVITPVYYDVTSDGINIDEKSELVNGIDIYTKEGFHILINEDFKIYGADNVKYAQLENAEINFISSVPLTKWTNQNIQIEIKRGGEFSADSQYTIQYKIGKNSDYQKYTTTLNIPENCEIYARIIDKDRRIIAPEQKVEVTKIDKIDPQINDFNVTVSCSKTEVMVDAQDSESNIDKIIVYANKSGANTSITKELDLETKKTLLELSNGTYNVYVEVYDKAGNMKTTSTQQITAIEHNPVYVGTADVHTKCSYCETVLSSTHTMTNTASASVCQECVCGYKITTHTPVNGGTKDIHKKCSVCTYIIQGNSSHSYTIETKDSTCIVKGSKKYTCGCGYNYTEELALADHVYWYYKSDGSVASKSGHPNGASTTYKYKCSVCSHVHSTHNTTKIYFNDVTASDQNTYAHYVKCTYSGGSTCYMADTGSSWAKYRAEKHYCSRCKTSMNLSTLNGRCNSSTTTSHNHYCSTCGHSGTGSSTHKCMYGCSNLSSYCGPNSGTHKCKCGKKRYYTASSWS